MPQASPNPDKDDKKPSTVRASKMHAAGLPRLYDPGYAFTESCTSSITLIDGTNGILRYRGYPIEQLAVNASFDEVAHLLLKGSLPSPSQLAAFRSSIAGPRATVVPKPVADVIAAFPPSAHPMTVLVAALAAMASAFPNLNPSVAGQAIYNDRARRSEAVSSVLQVMPPLLASILHHTATDTSPAVCPSSVERATFSDESILSQPYTARFLSLAKPQSSSVLINALDTLLILHADHEQNCSTSAVRHLSSSGVDVFSALSAGAAALYGPLHGGASEAVMHMLKRIGSPDRVHAFLAKVKNREERLMGFGHRVYKSYDPRAKIVRKLMADVIADLPPSAASDDLIAIATTLERAALSDQYFVSRKLYPNIDFYSGIIYRALGFEPSFYTALFALGRVVGWLTHWLEFLDDPDRRIARPQQCFTGVVGPRPVPRIEDRRDSQPVDLWDLSRPSAKL